MFPSSLASVFKEDSFVVCKPRGLNLTEIKNAGNWGSDHQFQHVWGSSSPHTNKQQLGVLQFHLIPKDSVNSTGYDFTWMPIPSPDCHLTF